MNIGQVHEHSKPGAYMAAIGGCFRICVRNAAGTLSLSWLRCCLLRIASGAMAVSRALSHYQAVITLNAPGQAVRITTINRPPAVILSYVHIICGPSGSTAHRHSPGGTNCYVQQPWTRGADRPARPTEGCVSVSPCPCPCAWPAAARARHAIITRCPHRMPPHASPTPPQTPSFTRQTRSACVLFVRMAVLAVAERAESESCALHFICRRVLKGWFGLTLLIPPSSL